MNLLKLVACIVFFFVGTSSYSQGEYDKYYQEIDVILESEKAGAIKAFFTKRILSSKLQGDIASAKYWKYHAVISYYDNNHKQAITSINKAVELAPSSAEMHYEKAVMIHDTKGSSDSSFKYINMAIKLKDTAHYRLYKGVYLQALHRVDEAIEEFGKARSMGCDEYELYLRYSTQLFFKNDLKTMLEIVSEGIEKYPTSFELKIMLGSRHVADANLNAAVAQYKMVIRDGYFGGMSQTMTKIIEEHSYEVMGDYMESYNKFEPAVNCFMKSLELKENNSDKIYSKIALALCELDRFDEAIELCAKKIETDKSPSEFMLALKAVVLYRRKDMEGSLKVMQVIVSLFPTANNYVDLGHSYLFLLRYEEALMSYNKALEIQENYCRAYSHMSEFYYEQEKYQEALEFAKKAIASNPKDRFSLFQIGRAKVALKLPGGCIDLERAIELGSPDANREYPELCK